MSLKIVIEPVRNSDGKAVHSSLGPLYKVWLDGEVLLEKTAMPFGDSARELQKRGYAGALEMASALSANPRMSGDIDKAAGLTVTESGGRCRFTKYTPVDYKKFHKAEKEKATPQTDADEDPS